MKTVIRVENLSKLYRIGSLGTGTISHDLNRWWARIRGKEDPFLKLGETNDRTKKGSNNLVWAIKDLNFEVKQGDVLGIIGKNGAGKSTLLKILSRTTTPTMGGFRTRGRIASLLEVGTGFHPELTGRENIFLNGAILGMKKAEIRSKFDEIVDFSGVERYIDTPVKRYSSGMYVRLAFAVAAHLEPEILIVDEVLAVGDQEFQDKCIGRMKDVSGSGRTVLFVSHNLPAVQSLCSTCLYMRQGRIESRGVTQQVIESYLSENRNVQLTGIIPQDLYRLSNGEAYFRSILINDLENNTVDRLGFSQPFKAVLELETMKDLKNVMININIGTSLGQQIVYAVDKTNTSYIGKDLKEGMHKIEVLFNLRLLPGNYAFTLGLNYLSNGNTVDWVENVYFITIDKVGYRLNENYPWEQSHGFIEPETSWTYKQ
jgi:lipopolysaccharide transport system ATP-binding protein